MRLKDPSELPRGAERFVAYLLHDIVMGFQKRKWKALLPLAFASSVVLGGLVAKFADGALWNPISNAIAFYAAALAVNAILLAVCWAAFSKILETLSDPDFGAWMRHTKMAQYYAFYVDYIHLTQMVAVAAMGAGLFTSLVGGLPYHLDRIILGMAVSASIYAAWWATGCVRVMQDLGDYRVKFRELDGKVTVLSKNNQRQG